MEQKKSPSYKELYKECAELKLRVSELEDELSDVESDLEDIYNEASYGSWNYRGEISEFSSIKRMAKR